jgi:hypothetical protein
LVLLALVRLSAAQTGPPVAIVGVVEDQTGAVLRAATVELVTSDGTVVQSKTTDAVGAFKFDAVPPGDYELRARFPGFKQATRRLHVGARAPGAQKLILALADVKEAVTVGSHGTQVDTTASNNLNAVSVDRHVLEQLPVLDLDFVAMLSRFVDAGSLGTGGVTLVVNGMEVSALRVSASAIQQITINQDPYAAEYGRPGRGRIEILTKPGGQQYEGEVNAVFRDAHLDARNAFAVTKPPEQKRIMDGLFGGPLGHGGKTSFLLSANDQTDDQQAIVFASGLSGPIHDVVRQPNSQALVSGTITRQVGDKTVLAITPSYEYEGNENRGVGGVTLASAGTIFTHHEQQITFTQQTAIRPNVMNQFQLLVGHERERTSSTSAAPGIVVADAFVGGGAQGDLVRTELHMRLTESLAWSTGHHLIQAGFQLPDWSRRGFFDRTNVDGTFYFSGLDTYAAGRPYAFVQQRGNGVLAFLEKQVGVYVKDDWQVRPGFSASLGLRYDWQNYFHDDDNLAPRASFAWAPHNNKKDVLRGGVGLFTDRSGPVVIADLLHAQPGGLTRHVISNPSYPDASLSLGASEPPSIVQLAPGVQIPRTLQFSLGIDHQVNKTMTLAVTYTGARGHHLFRSCDINAPLPPLYAARPNPAYGVIREIESNGRQVTDSLQVTVKGRLGRWFNGQSQYTLSRAWNDTNGITSYPANDYDLTGEWAPADFDRRHRLVLLGSMAPGRSINVGIGLTMNSAGRYTELLGQDIYNNGRGHARPAGVGRNTLDGAGFAQLDLRVSRDVKTGHGQDGHTFTFALDAFNVLNRVNYGTFVGTLGSPLFGQPISARPPRQMQVSVRLAF